MLVIFDLDDTLIDTSGTIGLVRLEKAFFHMCASGMRTENPAQALEMLKRLNSSALSARLALAEFAEIHDLPEKLLQIATQILYENKDLEVIPPLREGALELLQEVSSSHCLTLVTAGNAVLQKEKLKKAGIDTSLFSKIVVCPVGQKKIYYKAVIEEFCYLPSQVVVVGDRISSDLTPAKELGCKTVWLLAGRGQAEKGPTYDVDATATTLGEVQSILKGLSL